MAKAWILSDWPRRFPLLHEPVTVPGPWESEGIPFGRVAEGLGITFAALGRLRHRQFGPRHRWRGSRFIVLVGDLDAWMGRGWRSGEQAMLAELQHTDPADFLEARAQSSLEEIAAAQRLKK